MISTDADAPGRALSTSSAPPVRPTSSPRNIREGISVAGCRVCGCAGCTSASSTPGFGTGPRRFFGPCTIAGHDNFAFLTMCSSTRSILLERRRTRHANVIWDTDTSHNFMRTTGVPALLSAWRGKDCFQEHAGAAGVAPTGTPPKTRSPKLNRRKSKNCSSRVF